MCRQSDSLYCVVRAVHQSSSKLGDTPLARLDLFKPLPSRRFGCRASTTNSTAKSRSTSLYNARSSSRAGCRALQLYSAPERSTALQLYSALHSTSSTPSLSALQPLTRGDIESKGEGWTRNACARPPSMSARRERVRCAVWPPRACVRVSAVSCALALAPALRSYSRARDGRLSGKNTRFSV